MKVTANAVFLEHNEKALEAVSEKEWFDISENKTLISAGIKAIIKFLKKRGLPEPKIFFDLSVAAWVVESSTKSQKLAEISEFPQIYEKLLKLIEKRGVGRVLYEIEFPLIPILAEMEINGIGIDEKFLRKFKKEIGSKLADLEKNIYAVSGEQFNINSPSQVGEILFTKQKLAGGRKTKTGKFSTRESELIKLKGRSPLARLILDYRELAKLTTTYINPLISLSQKEPRIRTTFNQTGTVTGRLSSDSPNLQNIPVRSEIGAKLRDAFVSSAGFTFAAFDYSQIELKILASLANDKKMIDAFKGGLDIHKFTAANINNVPLEKVTPKMRYGAKTINFGIVYGMGVRRLAQSTGMTMAEAQKFYDEYFRDFPGIRSYMDGVKESAKAKGYVETLFGRKRFFDIEKIRGDRFLESEMERMAVNAVIQGTDSDIVKLAMIAVHNELSDGKIRPILQIHDELLYEIADDIIEEAVPRIRLIMEGACRLSVPLSVDIKIGKRWGSLKAYVE